jgi:iron complex transport system substrate-binding protein
MTMGKAIRLAAILAIFANGAAAAGAIPAAPPVEFTDSIGRPVRLERPPARILIVGHGTYILGHLLYMFPEGRTRLLGLERRGGGTSDFLPLIDPAFGEKRSLGPNPGPEEIAAIYPDVVLTRGTVPEPAVEAVRGIGIPVVYFGLETPDLYEKDIINLGLLLGDPSRAAEIRDFYRERLERIGRALAGLEDRDKPRVLLGLTIARAGKIAVQVPARPWMQTIQVLLAGGRPVWLAEAGPASGWTVINLEQIAAWNPDKIFLVAWHSLEPRKVIENFRADSRWKALKAVKNGELGAFPSDLYGWDTPDPRWILGLEWLAARTHPERFPEFDLKAEVFSFFGRLFFMDREAIEAKILPAIRADVF